VAVVGDVGTAEAVDLVTELFGEIPTGPAVPPVVPAAVAARPGRILLEDRVPLARLYLAWPSPALFADGDAELDLASDILAGGRTSRLYHRLVHERRVATELASAQTSRELGGLFQILATAAPGHTLEDLERAIHEELGQLIADGPTDDEMTRGRAQAEAAFVYRLESLGGFGGKADQLNAYNTYKGTPDWFAADLERYQSATAAGVQAHVRQWLDPAGALALSVVPAGETERALPGSEPVVWS
jgi:zinc protease